MATSIDINAMAASIYLTVLKLNSSATSLVGLDTIWCRLLPYENGEDVVVQEYTLHQYECPKSIKVVSSKTDYQAGAYNIDLWGMHQEIPLEINIDIATWKAVYGEGTMPLKGDFVLILLLHKAFEVKSSVIVYTIGEQATSYKCTLGQWQHNANRKENEDFQISIDELTESQDRLFGDAISKEVADAVVETETAYNTTTYVDPIKDFDINCIVLSDKLKGLDGNKFSEAYYHFLEAEKDVTYSLSATYDPTVKENHWIYSCWLHSNGEDNIQSAKVKLTGIYLKEKDYWYISILSDLKIAEGDKVTIYRGGVIKLTGIIETEDCSNNFVIKIATSECLKANKKVSNWWSSGAWKIQKYIVYNLFTAYNNDDTIMKIDIDSNNILFNINNNKKSLQITSGKAIDLDNWHYIAFDISPKSIRTILIRNAYAEATSKYTNNIVVDEIVNINNTEFSFDKAGIINKGLDIDICNIRLYENEYELADTYKLDMYSEATRNASKLILVDAPNAANDMSFITKVR